MAKEPNLLFPIAAAMAQSLETRPYLEAVSFWRVAHGDEPGFAAVAMQHAQDPGHYTMRIVTDMLGPGTKVVIPMTYHNQRLFTPAWVKGTISNSRIRSPMQRSIRDVIFSAAPARRVYVYGLGRFTITLHDSDGAARCIAGQSPFQPWPLPPSIKSETRQPKG